MQAQEAVCWRGRRALRRMTGKRRATRTTPLSAGCLGRVSPFLPANTRHRHVSVHHEGQTVLVLALPGAPLTGRHTHRRAACCGVSPTPWMQPASDALVMMHIMWAHILAVLRACVHAGTGRKRTEGPQLRFVSRVQRRAAVIDRPGSLPWLPSHQDDIRPANENFICKRRRFDHARRDSEGRRAEHRAGHQGVLCLHLRLPVVASPGALFSVGVHRRPEADTVAETGTAWTVAGRGAAGGGEVPQQPWHQAALTAGFVWCLRSWPASRRARWVRTSTRSPKALSPASWTSRSVASIPFCRA